MNSELPYIKSLLAAVEKYHLRSIRTTVDFEALSITIEQQTSERISASTLKRLWGYVSDRHEPRRYTLDVLSKYIGHRDFDSFCAKIDADPTNGSIFFAAFTLSSELLTVGDRVEIGWSPDRHLVLEYLGKNRYKIRESLNSKLIVDDEFTALSFMLGYPLYLSSVERSGKILPSFVAGSNGGLTIVSML